MATAGLDIPIVTRRLILRPYRPSDLDDLASLQGDPGQVRYVPFEPRSRDEVEDQLRWRLETGNHLATKEDRIAVAIVRRNDEAYLGDLLVFMNSFENRCGEIGYMLLAEHQGHGYMTEAVRSIVDATFSAFDLHRIVAHMDARNEASAAVATRVGMRLEAHHIEDDWFKGEWSSTFIYALLRSEWAAAQAR